MARRKSKRAADTEGTDDPTGMAAGGDLEVVKSETGTVEGSREENGNIVNSSLVVATPRQQSKGKRPQKNSKASDNRVFQALVSLICN